MRHFLLIMLLGLTSIFGYAQKFEITSNGVFNKEDHSKSFVVIEAQDKTASEIKDVLVNTLSKMYAHPDKVISVVGDNVIVVNGSAPTIFTEYGTRQGLNGTTSYTTDYSVDYSYRIEIKDNRIRVNAPTFSNLYYTLNYLGKHKTGGPFGQADFFEAVKEAKASSKVDKMMNDFLNCISVGLNTTDDW